MMKISRDMIRIYARKILGRRGTFLLRNIVSDLFYYTEFGEKIDRLDGISAVTILYNEEDWIRYSLLSIKDLVDEYIVMDSSNDRTPEIIRELIDNEGLNIRYEWVPPGNIPEVRNRGIRKARFKWILVWDADFILYDEAVKIIREVIESLRKNRHHMIYWPFITICGDLCHVCSEKPYHIEHWMYTYSDKVRYKYLGKIDSLIAPLSIYKVVFIKKPLGLHINARSPRRTAVKHLWYKHRDLFEKSRESFDEIAEELAEKEFSTKDLDLIGEKIIREMTRRLPLYREEVFGRYPASLRDKYLRCLEESS